MKFKKTLAIILFVVLYVVSHLSWAFSTSGKFINNLNESIYVIQLNDNEGGGNMNVSNPLTGSSCEIKFQNESCVLLPNESYSVAWTEDSGSSYDCLAFVTNINGSIKSLLPAQFYAYSNENGECNDSGNTPLTQALKANLQEIGYVAEEDYDSFPPIFLEWFDFNPLLNNQNGVSVVNRGLDESSSYIITFYP